MSFVGAISNYEERTFKLISFLRTDNDNKSERKKKVKTKKKCAS